MEAVSSMTIPFIPTKDGFLAEVIESWEPVKSAFDNFECRLSVERPRGREPLSTFASVVDADWEGRERRLERYIVWR